MSETVTETLDFSLLPKHTARQFVPETVDLENKKAVVGLLNQLLERKIASVQDLERWLLDRSEFDAALDQQGSILYIQMTCQTDDAARAERYKKFIEDVVPAVKPLADELNHKFTELMGKFPLDENVYGIYKRAIKTDIELFRDTNVPLETEIQLLSQEYQTIIGAMMVTFDGKEQTLPQMAKYLQEPDRALREKVWRLIAERRVQDAGKLDSLFDKMLSLRKIIAQNAGFKNFAEYQFRAYHRFDYSSAECKKYHEVIEQSVVPVWNKILSRRKTQMKIDALKPWDLQADPLGRPSLKPFNRVDQLIHGVNRIFNKVNALFGTQFTNMENTGLLDLASRKGKAPGGYQNTLSETRKPFIFMNAVGVDDDVYTLLHEGGHAFHALAAAGQPLHSYRHAPMEFCEVASMSMELLGKEYLETFYSQQDMTRSREEHWEGIIYLLCWVAQIDAFQHWIYENPNHTAEERKKMWVTLNRRFSGDIINWDGLQNYLDYLWHRQLHIFEVPFYYIEYGIAQLGALQIWQNTKQDKKLAVENYRKGLSLGGSRPLPEIFSAAGIRFDFSRDTIEPLVKAVAAELKL